MAFETAAFSFGGAIYGYSTGWSTYAADYNVKQRETTPVGWAAIVSLLIGLGGVLLGAAQVYYIGPVALWLSRPYGMDIGFELGFVFSGIAYYFLRRIELAQTNR